MQLNNIGMIAADTSRSKAYLQALIRNDMLPTYVLLLEHGAENILPGQQKVGNTKPSEVKETDPCWSEADFDSSQSLRTILDRSAIPYTVSPSANVNDLYSISGSKYLRITGKYCASFILQNDLLSVSGGK